MRMTCRLAIALILLGACASSEPDDADSGTVASVDSSGSQSASMTASESESASAESESEGESTNAGSESEGESTNAGTESVGDSSTTDTGPTQVQFETTLGNIVFELDETAAPITSANFLAYVDAGFFDGSDGLGATIFHRVVPDFVIQGGGLTEALDTKATMPAIVNESGNGLTNVRGAISMARTSDPNSATSQFFVNLVDNPGLDESPGYAVFGEVIEGMDVVDTIAALETETVGQYEGVPVEPVIVLSATRL